MSQPLRIATERNQVGFETDLFDKSLYAAAREFLGRPSKGLRARLIEVCYAIAGGTGSPPCAAIDMIELLHSGSLIVDDIQDGADVRRGGPALHQMIGMPRALNTGNWLYFVALTRLDELVLEPELARTLTRATHACLVDCHEGQALDLSLRVPDVERADMPSVVRLVTSLKTAAPMGLAARVGATVAGASPRVVETLVRFGERLGLALQMLDDLGSLVAPHRVHKGLEDLSNQCVSWVWAWVSEQVDQQTFDSLIASLSDGSDLASLRARLAEIVEPVARGRVRGLLETTELELRSNFPPSFVLDLVHSEIMRLERSYG